jgi:hypothetical protein
MALLTQNKTNLCELFKKMIIALFFCRKLSKIAENCRKSQKLSKIAKIVENRRKLSKIAKIVENRRKLSKIAKNCRKLQKIVIITSTPGRAQARAFTT